MVSALSMTCELRPHESNRRNAYTSFHGRHPLPPTQGWFMTTPNKTPSALKPTASAKAKDTIDAKDAKDAIALLKSDHETVSQLFAEYEKTKSVANKKALVAEICTSLSVHAQVEEEIFYPAVKLALKDKIMVPEAIIEQATMKSLIGQLEGVEPDGEMYDARVKVLAEYVTHHVKEEHTEMFPKAKASSLDMMDLGARMAARKAELLAEKA